MFENYGKDAARLTSAQHLVKLLVELFSTISPTGDHQMLHFRLTITPELRQALQRKLDLAQRHGDVRLVKWMLALLAVAQSQDRATAAAVLQLVEAMRL